MKLVLLYSHENDPITKSLIDINKCETIDLIKISLEYFLNNISVCDEVSCCKTVINWILPSGLTIVNDRNFFLVNRVLSVPSDLMNNFNDEDKNYALCEFRSYLTFAIEAFPNCHAKPGAFGLSGNRYSLPRQWETVKSKHPNLSVPKYYLGNMAYCDLKKNIIYSNPNNYYNWRVEGCVDKKNNFAFEKPTGIPVIAYIIGELVEVYPYTDTHNLSAKNACLIKKIALEISTVFKFTIAEILFFLDHNHLTFGMISNTPYSTKKKIWFATTIKNYFKKIAMIND